MARPIWETGFNLGTFYSGIPINIQLIAVPVSPATSITYSLVSGNLPNGLTVTTDGYIRGTIVNPNTNTVFDTNILVKAEDNLGNNSTKTFLLSFNYTLTQPTWNTQAGTLGVYPSLIATAIQLSATPTLPAVSVTYKLISGTLPNGLTLSEDGLISGIPSIVPDDSISTFVIRVTDNYANIRDRTFSMTITGTAIPELLTPQGTIFNTLDSTWIQYQILYTNPISTNPYRLRIIQGFLPPGLEMNSYGVIRGYAQPPIFELNLPPLDTAVVQIVDNVIVSLTTSGFRPTRPIIFSGVSFGDIEIGKVYYVKTVINSTEFTISDTVNGPTLQLLNGTGFMDVNLPIVTINQPTKKTYSFTVALESDYGNDSQNYNIVVTNQNMPTSQGGPGYPENTRVPTVFNTRPPTYDLTIGPNFGYYLLPTNENGLTYPPTTNAYIGQLESDNYFSFRILGHDFDGNNLTYSYIDLPLGLVGDANTGWITGTPVIASDSISSFSFRAYVRKTGNPNITSAIFGFSFKLANAITDIIIWNTDNDLGSILNGSISSLKVEATADVALNYRVVSGQLPPNLRLLPNGEITGQTAWQPNTDFVNPGTISTFTFTIEAYSPTYSVINNTKTFTVQVINEFVTPSDVLYIQATPSLQDRNLLRSLLDNDSLIPYQCLYRPTDPSFGKAENVIYAHAYGINASNFQQYVEAVTKNHYWRQLTLGSLGTAVAKNDNGEIVYEVVYSNVIDNLINPQGVSISEEIIWPRRINLNQGPWYTSSTNIYTSYVFSSDVQYLITQDDLNIITENDVNLTSEVGLATYYTSLTPGYARLLYPNSLPNMRNRVSQVLGVNADYRLLPKWMTSQQRNGSTLGFIPAWVICYTTVPVPITISATVTNAVTNTIQVSDTSNVLVGGEITFSGSTFGRIQPNTKYFVKAIDTTNNTIQISATQYGSVFYLTDGTGIMSAVYDAVSYAELIKHYIESNWLNPVGQNLALNQINFKIDRFTADKSSTYNYDNSTSPPSWLTYPSANPVPDPINSKDFYVLFPRQTILPDDSQYS